MKTEKKTKPTSSTQPISSKSTTPIINTKASSPLVNIVEMSKIAGDCAKKTMAEFKILLDHLQRRKMTLQKLEKHKQDGTVPLMIKSKRFILVTNIEPTIDWENIHRKHEEELLENLIYIRKTEYNESKNLISIINFIVFFKNLYLPIVQNKEIIKNSLISNDTTVQPTENDMILFLNNEMNMIKPNLVKIYNELIENFSTNLIYKENISKTKELEKQNKIENMVINEESNIQNIINITVEKKLNAAMKRLKLGGNKQKPTKPTQNKPAQKTNHQTKPVPKPLPKPKTSNPKKPIPKKGKVIPGKPKN